MVLFIACTGKSELELAFLFEFLFYRKKMSDFYRDNIRQLSLYIVHNYINGTYFFKISFMIAINVDTFCQI